jgi:hypothetical protein
MSLFRTGYPSSNHKIYEIPGVTQENFDAIEDWSDVEHSGLADATSGQHDAGRVGVVFVGTSVDISDLSPSSGAMVRNKETGTFGKFDGLSWYGIWANKYSRVRAFLSGAAFPITGDYTQRFDCNQVLWDTLHEFHTNPADPLSGSFTPSADGFYHVLASFAISAAGTSVFSNTSQPSGDSTVQWAPSGDATHTKNVWEYPSPSNELLKFNESMVSGAYDSFYPLSPVAYGGPDGASSIKVTATWRARLRNGSCACNNTCYHDATTCTCNNSCYGNQNCTCNLSCDGQGSCTCNLSCYQQSGCTCNNTCYAQTCTTCYNTCYTQTCTCNNATYNGCTCYLVCYGYMLGCTCNTACYGYTGACTCNSSCYVQTKEGCFCNAACYGYSCICNNMNYGLTCTCNNTCYQQACATCYNTCYSYGGSCGCNSSCYGQSSCTCNNACYGHVACSCDMTTYGYVLSCECNASQYMGTIQVAPEIYDPSVGWRRGDLTTIASTAYGTYSFLWATDPFRSVDWTAATASGINYIAYRLFTPWTAACGVSADVSQFYLSEVWFPPRPVLTLQIVKNEAVGSSSIVAQAMKPIAEAGSESYQTVSLSTIIPLKGADRISFKIKKTKNNDMSTNNYAYSFVSIHRLGGQWI